MAHKIFIASSGKNRDWAADLQELLDRITSDDFEFEVWDQDIFRPSSYVLHDLIQKASTSSAAIFLFAPDDEITINAETKKITRDNVIFELGLFTGHLGTSRVIVLASNDTNNFRMMSDIEGLTTVRFSFKPHHDNNRLSALGPSANAIKRHIERVIQSTDSINIHALHSVGLTEATYTTSHSSFSYVEAINASNTSFRLLGVGADKVTSNKEEFDNMIERVMGHEGIVRLLMLDPNSYSVIVNQRREEEFIKFQQNIKNSLYRIAETINLLGCQKYLKIKSYFVHQRDNMPPFRLTFVDEERCIVSPRDFSEGNRAEIQPQLIFRKSATQGGLGYYGAFHTYFESLWRQSTEETVETMLQKIDKLPKRIVPFGCVHGRFQPPHKGHLNYILMAKAQCEILYIGITQPDIESLSDCHADPHRAELQNNPLTFSERAEALRRMLSAHKLYERKDYVIIPFDIDRPDLLKRYIHHTWIQYTTLIDDWNIFKNARLKKLGYEVISLTDHREDERISGTEIRRLARERKPGYHDMVTKEVLTYLDEISFANRLTNA